MNRRTLMASLLALLLIGGGVGVILARLPGAAADAVTLDPALRTVVILTATDQRPILRDGDIAVELESGAFPPGLSRARVLTDKDCAPDADDVSHCLNDMQVGRRQFAVRHHHRMMEEPCFNPTEELNVMDVSTYHTLGGQS